MLLTHSIRRWLLLVLVIAACFWGMPAAQRTFVFAQETGVTATDSGSADEPLDLSIREWIERYEEISKAKDAFVANDVAGALERLKAAAASHAELPPGEVMLADLFFLANNPTGAIASLDQAVRQYPEDPEPYLVLGNFAFAQNRNTEAKLLFQQANRLFKSYQGDATRKRRIGVRLYAGLASIAERAEEYSKALPYLNSWVQLDPKNATPRVRLAQTLFRADKGREAYAEAQKAVQLNDKLPAASFLIAQFYTQKGDLDLARKWLAAAEKKHPKDLMTRLGITEWHWQQGEVREAKRHAQVAYEIDPTSARSAILAGMIAHVEGDYESAEKYFQDAQLAAPDDFNARNHLVMVLAAQDDPAKNERALKLAETNRRDFPNNPIAIATLGWTQLQTGDTTEAGKSLQLAASSRQLTADTAYFLAKFMADRGDKEQARKALKQVLDTRPLFVYRKAAEKLNDKIK